MPLYMAVVSNVGVATELITNPVRHLGIVYVHLGLYFTDQPLSSFSPRSPLNYDVQSTQRQNPSQGTRNDSFCLRQHRDTAASSSRYSIDGQRQFLQLVCTLFFSLTRCQTIFKVVCRWEAVCSQRRAASAVCAPGLCATFHLQTSHRRLPFFRASRSLDDPSDGSLVRSHSERVDLATPKHYLNTVIMESTSPSPSAPPPAVLLHGYGAGLGFFYQNLPTLAEWAGRRGSSAYALDWLGMGRSARVPFTVKAKKDDIQGRVKEAESFFIDSLEEWRQKMGLEKMTLIGHSLGGYLSVAYALRHPTRVSKLILLSPAGVPRDPNSTVPARELTDTQEGTAVATGAGSGSVERATRAKVEQIHAEQQAEKREMSRTRRLLLHLWEEGWSPFQVVRSTLFLGPMLVGKVSSICLLVGSSC
jgi:pimeloyl-ACP methyl ester carboxylesterase